MIRQDTTHPIVTRKGAELHDKLHHLRHRIGDCRDTARSCHSAFVALSLEELADHLEAEAALMTAKLDLFTRLEAPLS